MVGGCLLEVGESWRSWWGFVGLEGVDGSWLGLVGARVC